jgi:photosystem II stability/assembly factor-like uncharacterized protein
MFLAVAAARAAAGTETASGATTPTIGSALPVAPAAVFDDIPSEPARLASRSLMLDLAVAGSRLVAVGERGQILLSDDQGSTWNQAPTPTQSLLTGVCFSDAQHGIAVGHDEIALLTSDAGASWKRTHYAPQAQQPLLDVWCGTGGRAIAVGAYGVYLVSSDGGLTWEERKMDAAPAAAPAPKEADDAGGGFHLNAIAADSKSRLYIAGEAGHLYRSDDGGNKWVSLHSPYEGSLFGVLPLGGDTVLAFGLRGNLFRSENAGVTWERIETGTVAMLDGGTTLGGDGGSTQVARNVALVGLSGTILVSRDAGKTFSLFQQGDRKGIAAVLASEAPGQAGALVTVGEAGANRQRIPAAGPTIARTAANR